MTEIDETLEVTSTFLAAMRSSTKRSFLISVPFHRGGFSWAERWLCLRECRFSSMSDDSSDVSRTQFFRLLLTLSAWKPPKDDDGRVSLSVSGDEGRVKNLSSDVARFGSCGAPPGSVSQGRKDPVPHLYLHLSSAQEIGSHFYCLVGSSALNHLVQAYRMIHAVKCF